MLDQTHVTLLLDRSGSMESCRDATIEAYNGYVAGLRGDGGPNAEIRFTFLQFDTQSLDKVHVGVSIAGVPDLSRETYVPRGGTPLVDACVKTIKAVEAAIVAAGGKPKVVVAFQTDGLENASTEHTVEELRGLIAARTAEGWQFTFLGAGIDAYAQAGVFGIAGVNAMSYDQRDKGATRAAFAASAENTRAYAMGARNEVSYSATQRSAAGDRFTPANIGGFVTTTVDPGAERLAKAILGPRLRRKTVADIKL